MPDYSSPLYFRHQRMMTDADIRKIIEAGIDVLKTVGFTIHGNDEFNAYLSDYGCLISGTHVDFTDAVISKTIGGTPNALARFTGYVKNNIPYQLPFFPVNNMRFTEEENDTIVLHDTEIEMYSMEMRGKFIAGISDIDGEWDVYVNTIKSMGLDDVLAAYQTAYDRWQAA